MGNNKQFDDKWGGIMGKGKGSIDEKTLFVPVDRNPVTQRQFNLYHYFEFIEKQIKGKGYTTAVEVGCGRGTIALYLKKYLGMDVTLVDSSQDGIELAKYNFDLWRADGKFFVEDARNMNFPEESFDLVVTIGLLEHFEDYSPVLSEMYRVLKKGGMVISLNIPKKSSIQKLNSLYRKFIGKVHGTVHLKPDYFRNSDLPEHYKRQAEQAGFINVETMYVNSFPLFTPVPLWVERALAALYRAIYGFRRLFKRYPFAASSGLAQAHFLVGEKPRKL